jgi:hypothetical protein
MSYEAKTWYTEEDIEFLTRVEPDDLEPTPEMKGEDSEETKKQVSCDDLPF